MINKIKSKIIGNKTIVANFSYLSLLQVINTLVPLLIYPYVIRKLGSDKYGLVVYAQGVIAYFVLLVNFGFNITGTKFIAQNKEDVQAKSEVVSSIYQIKTVFVLISFALLMVLTLFIGKVSEYSFLFIITFHLCLFEAYYPIWFFQGIEKMKYITFFNVIGRILYVLLIFLLIKNPSDYFNLPLINSFVTIIVIAISNYVIFGKEKLKFQFVSFNKLKFYTKESFDFFLSNAMVAFKERSNIFILGTFVSMNDVALYDFITKIIQVVKMPFMMFRDAIFPHYARIKSMKGYNWIVFFASTFSLVIYLLVMFFYGDIENFISGSELKGGVAYYYYLGLFIPLGIFSMFLGTGIILQNENKGYRRSILYSVSTYFTGIIILYYKNLLDNIFALIFVFILSLIVELFIRCFVYNWGTRKTREY